MQRLIQPEWLDELPPADQPAIRSRRDLRRVNAWMRNVDLVTRALEAAELLPPPRRVVDLGAGDGTFLLAVARRLAPRWRPVEAVLVDRQNILDERTVAGFQALGWTVRLVQSELSDWLSADDGDPADVLLANLFLHHFATEQLRRLLGRAADDARLFVACEPERSPLSLAGARLVGLIGCNRVTCHDAVVSVRAGFNGRELAALWPEPAGWRLRETRAGWFSHLFQARREKANHG